MRGAVLLLLLACGGKDSEDSGHTTPTETRDTYAATWSGAQELFGDHCETCHPATNGLDLAAAIEADLRSGSGAYVVAGDAEASALWEALGGTTLSSMMPPSGRLDADIVEPVRTWIESGAPLESP